MVNLKELVFHHVGIITPALEKATEFYRALGYNHSEIFRDPIQKVRIVLMTQKNGPMVELIEPADQTSPAHSWLKRIKAGSYHTCYSTPKIAETIGELELAEFRLISGPDPAVAFGGKRVAFLMNFEIGLIELVEA